MGTRQAAMADVALKFARENWIIIGGIITACWTGFQFLENRKIPFNVSIDLTTDIDPGSKEVLASGPEAKKTLPVIFKVTIENKSDWRELAIRNPVWVAYGYRLAAQVDSSGKQVKSITAEEMRRRINTSFSSNLNEKMSADASGDRRLRDHSYVKEPIGAGTLMGDPEIKPKETLSTQHILPVAYGAYDFIQIRAYVPTLTQGKEAAGYSARLILNNAKTGRDEPQVLFCRQQEGKCSIISGMDNTPKGGQIHASASEIWLGKLSSK